MSKNAEAESSQQGSGASTAGSPASRRIRQVTFDDHAAQLIAETLGTTSSPAPFRLPSGAVYQVLVPDRNGAPAVMLTLWPSIRRVDAISPTATIVLTEVVTADLVGDVEVQFRRSNRDCLIVARGGKVIVRA